MTALHPAIQEWNDDLIQWLLEHEPQIDVPDELGNTPLMLAVSQGIHRWHCEGLGTAPGDS